MLNISKVFLFFQKVFHKLIMYVPGFSFLKNTIGTQTPITFSYFFWQKIIGYNYYAYWPVHFSSKVNNPEQVELGVDTSPGYMPNCYIQGAGGIQIGDYTQIGPNVGIISANHDPIDNRVHIKKKVIIGKYCWIGMGAIILPGVELGDFTVVAANSVVTKSVSSGYTIIGGNPAKKIKDIDESKCYRFTNKKEYIGYYPKDIFLKSQLNFKFNKSNSK